MKISVAIVGATGAVGQVMREILEQREFPVENLYLLASEKSEGKRLQFQGRSIAVQNLADFDFSQVQLALFSAGGSVSAEYGQRAVDAGCVIVDNTSHFRYDDDVPLIVPEVNPELIPEGRHRGIIANPNCSTIQMVVALKPIYDAVGIERINVATYQAVSGAGNLAIQELAGQTAALLNANPVESSVLPVQIAFNVIPQIDQFEDNGYTREEMKMVWETRKIFADPEIRVNPTCVRVPVFYGHSEAVHIETRDSISALEAAELLQEAAGVKISDSANPTAYDTPALQGAENDAVLVSRIREDLSHPRGLNLWIVSDNLRKGAALNSVQIGELLLKELC